MLKVLVFGGAGFIGSHTVDLLLNKGYEVRILDSLESPVHQDGAIPAYIPKKVEFISADVRDRQAVARALEGVDIVFQLAAYQDYLPDFSKFFHVNSVGTALIYELIVEKRYKVQKVILGSSQAVYGEGKYKCPFHGIQYPGQRPMAQLLQRDWEFKCPVCGGEMSLLPTDEAVVNPHNPYAISKYSQEMIALNLGKRYGIPTVCLRYSITQGPRQSFSNAYSGICRNFTTRLLNNKRPIVYEDGKQLRDYVHVADVARANILALEEPRADYEVFNVGGDNIISVLEYAYLIAEKMDKSIEPLVPGAFRFGDTRHVVSDAGRIQTLGWKATMPLEKIVEDYIAWVSEQPDIKDYYAEAEKVMERVGIIVKVSNKAGGSL